jgi:Flp pilus assembly protein TadG
VRATSTKPRQASGQTLVTFAIALVALLGGTGLVIDGGNAFSQQRQVQNAADASANAGAVVLMQNLVASYNGAAAPNGDAAVLSAVNTKASQNGILTPVAFYTAINGWCITAAGGVNAPPCSAAANDVQVGNGTIPTVNADSNGNPRCPQLPNGPTTTAACGVAVTGAKNFDTYVSGVIGINQLTATAGATATTGVVTTICAGTEPCNFIPLTFPTTLTSCDGQNKQYEYGNAGNYRPVDAPFTAANETIIGICSAGAGTVGWLAITPEDGQPGWAGTVACGGGKSDLTCDIENPDNPPLTLPVWIQTESGNTNNVNVDAALNGYDGLTIVIPLYDCVGSNETQSSTHTCQQAVVQQGGSNLSFHVVGWTAMLLDHAYINGNNPECNQPPGSPRAGGNGATGCLKGWITNYSVPGGTIGVGNGAPNSVFGVQLIR